MARRRQLVVLAVLALTLSASGIARAAGPGTLDSSFGSGGITSLGSGTQLFGVTVQPNGAVLAAGQSAGSAFVERLTPGGAPDGSFGSGGRAIGPGGVARAIALQSDGKVVIAGTSGGMFVMRLNSNGTADGSFGSGGVARAFSGSGAGNAVGVQRDGKIVVAGSVNPIDTRIAVARFNANGTPDASFGTGGAEVVDLGLPYAVAQGLALQADGKLVLVGREQGSPFYAFFNGLVLRLNSNGALDASFNGSGVVSFHQSGGGGSGYDALNAVAIQNDGKIVAAGSDVGGPYAIFLRLNPSGAFDSTYGSGGESVLSSGNATSRPYGAYGVGIGGGGRIIGAGAIGLNGTDLRAGVWATEANGAPVASFGSGGIVEQQNAAEACALAVAPDGGLIVVGQTVSASPPSDPCTGLTGQNAFVARYVGFGPPPPPAQPGVAPVVSTGAASAVSQTAATLAGQVNPEGLATTYVFQYGTTTAYGSASPPASAGTGTAPDSVSLTLGGLSPGTTYHYRLAATNSAGTANGQDATFTTAPVGPPNAATAGARAGEISATVSGVVKANGLATSYHVDYGKTSHYGSRSATATFAASSTSVNVSAVIKNLRPSTTYHYRLVAANSAGLSFGGDRTFTTKPSLSSQVGGLSANYRLAAVLSKGVTLSVGCNQACSIKGSLTVSGRVARRLGLGRRAVSIAGRSTSLHSRGTTSLTIKLSKAAKAALAKQRGSLSASLQVTSSPVGGGRSVVVEKSVTLA